MSGKDKSSDVVAKPEQPKAVRCLVTFFHESNSIKPVLSVKAFSVKKKQPQNPQIYVKKNEDSFSAFLVLFFFFLVLSASQFPIQTPF